MLQDGSPEPTPAVFFPHQASAFSLFGDSKQAETDYVNETGAVIAQIRVRAERGSLRIAHVSEYVPITRTECSQETLALDKDDPKKVDSIAQTRKITNDVRPRFHPAARICCVI